MEWLPGAKGHVHDLACFKCCSFLIKRLVTKTQLGIPAPKLKKPPFPWRGQMLTRQLHVLYTAVRGNKEGMGDKLQTKDKAEGPLTTCPMQALTH